MYKKSYFNTNIHVGCYLIRIMCPFMYILYVYMLSNYVVGLASCCTTTYIASFSYSSVLLLHVSVCMCVISNIHVSVDLHITGAYHF